MQNEKVSDATTLIIERSFDHPVKEVFAAFSNADALVSWWPPAGFTTTAQRFDFRPGGMFLFKMENAEMTMWAKLVFIRIEPNSYLEFVLSFSDENGGLSRAPFFENWPLKIPNMVEFTQNGHGTEVMMRSRPAEATPEEIISFKTNRDSFEAGTEASYEQLAKYLG